MDTFFLTLYLDELNTACTSALKAVRRLDRCFDDQQLDIPSVFYELHSFLSHFAAASRLLWPPNSSGKRGVERGADLRLELSVQDDHVVQNRNLRNHLEHYDERLDAWIQESRHHNIATNIVGPQGFFGGPNMSQSDVFRQYDPIQKTFIFRGETFDVQKLVDGIADIQSRIRTARKPSNTRV